jgi:hypothetical protein
MFPSHDRYPKDFITVNGKKCKPAKFYDEQLKKYFPDEYEEIKDKRANNCDANHPDLHPDRLKTREGIHERKAKRLARKL